MEGNIIMSEDKYYCAECTAELEENFDPMMCCSGRECGCRGMPTNPPFCHDKPCYERYSQRNRLEHDMIRAKTVLEKVSESNDVNEIHKIAKIFLKEQG
jgi:hypothetical protein